MVMPKPPYPVRIVGVVGDGDRSARRRQNRVTSVPSVDGYRSRSTAKVEASRPVGRVAHGASPPSPVHR
jgi:hypothetical protein